MKSLRLTAVPGRSSGEHEAQPLMDLQVGSGTIHLGLRRQCGPVL